MNDSFLVWFLVGLPLLALTSRAVASEASDACSGCNFPIEQYNHYLDTIQKNGDPVKTAAQACAKKTNSSQCCDEANRDCRIMTQYIHNEARCLQTSDTYLTCFCNGENYVANKYVHDTSVSALQYLNQNLKANCPGYANGKGTGRLCDSMQKQMQEIQDAQEITTALNQELEVCPDYPSWSGQCDARCIASIFIVLAFAIGATVGVVLWRKRQAKQQNHATAKLSTMYDMPS